MDSHPLHVVIFHRAPGDCAGQSQTAVRGICIAPRSDGQAIGIMVKLKEKNEGASALVLRMLAPQNKSV